MSHACSIDSRILGEFRRFCEQAVPALERSKPEPPLAEFEHFLDQAQPLLLESASRRLDVLQEVMQFLSPWLLEEQLDLFRVAQLTWNEDAYTELVAWVIDPATHHEIGAICQRAWLSALGISERVDPVSPVTQFATDDGIPDLVLSYPNLLIVVEAKTSTTEHPTPSSEQQTIAYPTAVRQRFRRPHNFRTEVVYLTVDGSEAANSDAIRTSYFELAVVLARTLTEQDMPEDLKSLYRLIISHFATQTADFGVDLRQLRFLVEDVPDENQLIKHLSALTKMLILLPERESK